MKITQISLIFACALLAVKTSTFAQDTPDDKKAEAPKEDSSKEEPKKEEPKEEPKKEEPKEEPKKEEPKAEDAQEEAPEDAPPKAEDGKKSKEERKKENEELEKKEKEENAKMMAVFKTLEGEWVGEEGVDYNQELFPGLADVEDESWKDEWKGFYTQEGRYFEMTGKAVGERSSTYHWYVTWDSSRDQYRAWSFGSTGFGCFAGKLTKDGKGVHWNKLDMRENLEEDFEMRADGDRATATGQTRVVDPDSGRSVIFAKQNSTYTRKKIDL